MFLTNKGGIYKQILDLKKPVPDIKKNATVDDWVTYIGNNKPPFITKFGVVWDNYKSKKYENSEECIHFSKFHNARDYNWFEFNLDNRGFLIGPNNFFGKNLYLDKLSIFILRVSELENKLYSLGFNEKREYYDFREFLDYQSLHHKKKSTLIGLSTLTGYYEGSEDVQVNLYDDYNGTDANAYQKRVERPKVSFKLGVCLP